MNLFKDLADLLYPVTCPGCGRVMDRDIVWCSSCLTKIWNPRLINSSRTEHLQGCYTLCSYEGAVRNCIIEVKYGGRADRKQVFYPLLARFPYWDRLSAFHLVIPVPLSKKKKEARGYNQVDLMFEDWMKEQGKTYLPQGLVRFRSAETQSLLSRRERYENIRGVFHINKNLDIKGKSILIADDVYTTGATMEAAAHELMRAGAKTVMGITIASGAM
ncbi:ComF family protein [Dialister sp.]|uniref:ComF family protein n=1 Tax=Dialister sp. TaxID=1955814 RepID=UPI003F086068